MNMKQKKIANFMTAMILFGNMGTTIAHANQINTTLEQNAETNIENLDIHETNSGKITEIARFNFNNYVKIEPNGNDEKKHIVIVWNHETLTKIVVIQ